MYWGHPDACALNNDTVGHMMHGKTRVRNNETPQKVLRMQDNDFVL